jgi:hypothetical protein
MLRMMVSRTPFGVPRHICASACRPRGFHFEFLHTDPSYKSPQTPSFDSCSAALKSAKLRVRFATHSKTGFPVSHRKQTVDPIPVRNTFRELRTSIPARFSAGFFREFSVFAAGSNSRSRASQIPALIARAKKVPAHVRAYFLPASFAFPSGTQCLRSCRINHLGRGI